jgi:hypothetical protein
MALLIPLQSTTRPRKCARIPRRLLRAKTETPATVRGRLPIPRSVNWREDVARLAIPVRSRVGGVVLVNERANNNGKCST